ncbi:MAG: Ig-like domain-containing protein [Clostridia bacterium]|nr:Ig-like domain-containing protein [Clostridia bacterium]
MKRLVNSKGITLIALIITIIVLLILAGVTIAAITGNESAPEKAVEARQANEVGAAKDAATLLVANKIQGYYEAKYVNRTSNAETVLEYLQTELAANKNVTTDGCKIVVSGGKITVTKIGESQALAQGVVSGDGVITWINPVPISSISEISATNTEVGVGAVINLSVTINEDATDSVIWTSSDETKATVISSGQNTATVTGVATGEVTIIAKNEDNSISKTIPITVTVAVASQEARTDTSYVGYYTEVNGVWGIIYADLLMQEPDSSTLSPWGNSNGAWSFPTGISTNPNDYKKYTVSSVIPTGKTTMPVTGYESTGVISLASGGGSTNRFLVMAMNNESGTYTWDDACELPGNGWTLPTKDQWLMFGSAFGVDKENYKYDKGLSDTYWSITEGSNTKRACRAHFINGYIDYTVKTYEYWVRLCTTF